MSALKDAKYTDLYYLRLDYAEERVKLAMLAVCEEWYSASVSGEVSRKAYDCFQKCMKEDPCRYVGGRDSIQWRHFHHFYDYLSEATSALNAARRGVVYFSSSRADERLDNNVKHIPVYMALGCVKRFAPAVRAVALELPVERRAQLGNDVNVCVNFFIGACDKATKLMGKINLENSRWRAGFCALDLLVIFYAALLDWVFALCDELHREHPLLRLSGYVRESTKAALKDWQELLIAASSHFAWRYERASLFEFGKTHGGVHEDIAHHFYTQSSKW